MFDVGYFPPNTAPDAFYAPASFPFRCRTGNQKSPGPACQGAYNDALRCESTSRDMSAQITASCGASND